MPRPLTVFTALLLSACILFSFSVTTDCFATAVVSTLCSSSTQITCFSLSPCDFSSPLETADCFSFSVETFNLFSSALRTGVLLPIFPSAGSCEVVSFPSRIKSKSLSLFTGSIFSSASTIITSVKGDFCFSFSAVLTSFL